MASSTINTVKALVDHVGGPQYIIGFRFANGYKTIYSRKGHLLEPEKDFVTIDGTEYLIYEHHDSNGHILLSYLEVEEITQVYVLPNLKDNVNLREVLE